MLMEILAALSPADTLPPLPQTGWEETTILAAAMAEDKEGFVRALLPHSLAVAGRAAASPAVRGHLSTGLMDELRWALVERSRDAGADLRARIAAGLVLGDLGDPRFERARGPWGEYLLPPLVDVSGGVYTIGDDEPITWDNRGTPFTTMAHVPARHVEIPAFRIGQFAVTNAEWACFMAAGGYEDEPTEVQWEAAVRGTQANAYPWGDDFDPTRANTFETRIRRSTPIGAFPEGDSASGIADGAGNVFEWTSSLWELVEDADGEDPEFGYPYDPDDGRENREAPPSATRVLRGGSWGDSQDDCRPAFRLNHPPAYRLVFVGFRVVRRSPNFPEPLSSGAA